MATNTATITMPRKPRGAGRPRRDLVKTTISMNAEAMALWYKMSANVTKTPQITTLETIVRDAARAKGITVTPEEIKALTGFAPEPEPVA